LLHGGKGNKFLWPGIRTGVKKGYSDWGRFGNPVRSWGLEWGVTWIQEVEPRNESCKNKNKKKKAKDVERERKKEQKTLGWGGVGGGAPPQKGSQIPP